VYFISTELDSFARGILKKGIDGVRRLWRNFMVLRSVECGTPVALGSTISFREGADRESALMQIVRAVEDIAAELGVGVVLFRDFYEEELSFYDVLRDGGYRMIYNLSATRLKVRWKSFDEYLDSMRSQYRTKLLVQVKKFHGNGNARIDFVQEFSSCAEDLARLWRNVYDQAREYRREILPVDFFVNIDRHLGSRSAVLIARVDDRPVGFLLLLFDDDVLIPLFSGLDYSCSRERGTYFNLFYKAVEIAIERGMEEMDLGITTLEPKLDLGAVVVPLHMYMKHRNPLLNRVVPKVFDMMTPKTSLRQRNVFKR
jgi:predicted N-acyltransferase